MTAIYLSPIFESPSALKFDATTLHHVDNNLGPDPEGDRIVWATENPGDPASWKWTSADRAFLRLVQECHRRQIKVVLDGVFDRVGPTFWALRDARGRGAGSKYAGWFEGLEDTKPTDEAPGHEAFPGARTLVAFRREADTLAAGPREHIRAVLRRWGDPNGDGDASDGVDGWRLRGAGKLGRRFLRELRQWIVGTNQEALILGGQLLEDEAHRPSADPLPAMEREDFDAALNYRFAEAAKAFFVDRESAVSAAELDARLAQARPLRPDTAAAMLNLVDSDETDRVASQLVNPDRDLGHAASPQDNPRYDLRAPRGEEGLRLRLLAAFQFAALGAPLVYYGTEAGIWGASGLESARPMPWRDLKFEDDGAHPLGSPRRRDPVRFDEELYRYYATLGRIRSEQPALRRGSFETLIAADKRRVYAFRRVLEDERVVAAFNASDREQPVELPAPGEAVRELLGGRRYRSRDGKLGLSLAPFSAVLLARETRAE